MGSVNTRAGEVSLFDEFGLVEMNEKGMWLLELWLKSELAV